MNMESVTDGLFVFLMWLAFWSWGYLAGLREGRKEKR
jgi:hypothetical protein